MMMEYVCICDDGGKKWLTELPFWKTTNTVIFKSELV